MIVFEYERSIYIFVVSGVDQLGIVQLLVELLVGRFVVELLGVRNFDIFACLASILSFANFSFAHI